MASFHKVKSWMVVSEVYRVRGKYAKTRVLDTEEGGDGGAQFGHYGTWLKIIDVNNPESGGDGPWTDAIARYDGGGNGDSGTRNGVRHLLEEGEGKDELGAWRMKVKNVKSGDWDPTLVHPVYDDEKTGKIPLTIERKERNWRYPPDPDTSDSEAGDMDMPEFFTVEEAVVDWKKGSPKFVQHGREPQFGALAVWSREATRKVPAGSESDGKEDLVDERVTEFFIAVADTGAQEVRILKLVPEQWVERRTCDPGNHMNISPLKWNEDRGGYEEAPNDCWGAKFTEVAIIGRRPEECGDVWSAAREGSSGKWAEYDDKPGYLKLEKLRAWSGAPGADGVVDDRDESVEGKGNRFEFPQAGGTWALSDAGLAVIEKEVETESGEVEPEPRLLVSERAANRISEFKLLTGEYVGIFAGGSQSQGSQATLLDQPGQMVVLPNRKLVAVADGEQNRRVQVFSYADAGAGAGAGAGLRGKSKQGKGKGKAKDDGPALGSDRQPVAVIDLSAGMRENAKRGSTALLADPANDDLVVVFEAKAAAATAKTKASAAKASSGAGAGSASSSSDIAYLEFVDKAKNSSKFWQCEAFRDGSTVVTFGKIGTNGGKPSRKEHGTHEKALKFMAKMKAQKTKKGYVEKKKGGTAGASGSGSSSSSCSATGSSSGTTSSQYRWGEKKWEPPVRQLQLYQPSTTGDHGFEKSSFSKTFLPLNDWENDDEGAVAETAKQQWGLQNNQSPCILSWNPALRKNSEAATEGTKGKKAADGSLQMTGALAAMGPKKGGDHRYVYLWGDGGGANDGGLEVMDEERSEEQEGSVHSWFNRFPRTPSPFERPSEYDDADY
eukprot:g1776.t1